MSTPKYIRISNINCLDVGGKLYENGILYEKLPSDGCYRLTFQPRSKCGKKQCGCKTGIIGYASRGMTPYLAYEFMYAHYLLRRPGTPHDSYDHGYIYVIREMPSGAIKIGFTENVRTRLDTLQGANPRRLKLLFCWRGSMTQERQLHRDLQRFRIHREWYEPRHQVIIRCRALCAAKSAKPRHRKLAGMQIARTKKHKVTAPP